MLLLVAMAAAEWLAGLVAAVLVPDHAAHCAAGGQQHQGEPAEARASHQEPGVSRGQEYKISSP